MAQRTWQQQSFIDKLSTPRQVGVGLGLLCPPPPASISQAEKDRVWQKIENSILYSFIVGEEMPVKKIRKLFGNVNNKNNFSNTIITLMDKKGMYWKDIVKKLGITEKQKQNILDYYVKK